MDNSLASAFRRDGNAAVSVIYENRKCIYYNECECVCVSERESILKRDREYVFK